MEAVYLNDFDSLDDVLRQFDIVAERLCGSEILLASYSYENYEGQAFVLLRNADGSLSEVNGGHCSCYGLEGQWEPEDTTLDALTHRLQSGELGTSYYGDDVFRSELAKVLDRLIVQ